MVLVIPQKIEVKWHVKNRDHFISKGYIYTKLKDSFFVSVEDLNEGSSFNVDYICDYCQETFKIAYKTYFRKREDSIIKKDCCRKCQPLKSDESNILLYGVRNALQRPDVKEKGEITRLERYGVRHPSQISGHADKIKSTSMERYGVNHYTQLAETQEKKYATNLLRYGVKNVSESKEIMSKALQTFKSRYGGIGAGSPIIAKKISETTAKRYADGALKKRWKTSKQQEFIHSITGGEYNYPMSLYALDIAFPEDKIFIEYDGGGHDLSVKFGNITQEEFDEKEIERFETAYYQNGWREIRLVSYSDKLPDRENLLRIINEAYKELQELPYVIKKKIFLEEIQGLDIHRVKGEV